MVLSDIDHHRKNPAHIGDLSCWSKAPPVHSDWPGPHCRCWEGWCHHGLGDLWEVDLGFFPPVLQTSLLMACSNPKVTAWVNVGVLCWEHSIIQKNLKACFSAFKTLSKHVLQQCQLLAPGNTPQQWSHPHFKGNMWGHYVSKYSACQWKSIDDDEFWFLLTGARYRMVSKG